jgi:hypothetical protein
VAADKPGRRLRPTGADQELALRRVVTADDLVHRRFHRLRPNALWVIDFERQGAVEPSGVKDTTTAVLSQRRGDAESSPTPGSRARVEATLTTTGQARVESPTVV